MSNRKNIHVVRSIHWFLKHNWEETIIWCDGDECRYIYCFSFLIWSLSRKRKSLRGPFIVFLYHIICHFQSHRCPLPHSLLRHHSRPHQGRNHHRRNLSCRCCRLWKVSSWAWCSTWQDEKIRGGIFLPSCKIISYGMVLGKCDALFFTFKVTK